MPNDSQTTRRRVFWANVKKGWVFGNLVLMPLWIPLLGYCLWEIAHGR